MNPLQARKELLIAESELNRAKLGQEWQKLTDDVGVLAHRATSVSSLTLVAASLVVELLSTRQKNLAPTDKKSSWLQIILKGAGVASTLWSAFRPQGRGQK